MVLDITEFKYDLFIMLDSILTITHHMLVPSYAFRRLLSVDSCSRLIPEVLIRRQLLGLRGLGIAQADTRSHLRVSLSSVNRP
jgi:hypothetical protein